MKQFVLAVLAYLVPTFALGYVWHLVLFDGYYDALHIYRDEIVIPLGFAAILTQGCLFAWIYAKAFAKSSASFAGRVLGYGALGALLSWSFTTLTVAAKNIMSSVPSYMLIETCFTLVQWFMVAPLTALVFSQRSTSEPSARV